MSAILNTFSTVLVAVLSVAAAHGIDNAPPARIPVIHTTDLYCPADDFDDWYDLACIYALPEIDLKAVILDDDHDQAHRPGRIPVTMMNTLSGKDVPWGLGLQKPLKSLEDTGVDNPDKEHNGIDLMLSILKSSPSPVTFNVVGSLRSVAAAYNRDPELVRQKVGRIYVFASGGPSRENKRRPAGQLECNVALDKFAYVRIMNSGLPIYWVPCGLSVRNSGPSMLKNVTMPLFNYFRYGSSFIYRTAWDVPPSKDPIQELYRPSTEDERVYTMAGKQLWCSGIFVHIANRVCVLRGNECLAIPKSELKEGDIPKDVFSFVSESIYVDPETAYEYVEENPNAHSMMLFQRVSTHYAEYMTSITRNLLEEFSQRIRSSKPMPNTPGVAIPANTADLFAIMQPPPGKVPIIHTANLYQPHDDFDDRLSLACLFAMPEIDLKAVILDDDYGQEKRPDPAPVKQINAITGKNIPWAIGLPIPLKSLDDPGLDGADRSNKGIDLILGILKSATTPVTISAAGSLRSVAAAFNRDPDLFKTKVGRIFILAGTYGKRDPASPLEHEAALDKQAYARIMNSGLPIYWAPRNISSWAGNASVLNSISDPLLNYFRYSTKEMSDPVKALHDLIPADERNQIQASLGLLSGVNVDVRIAGRLLVSSINKPDESYAVPQSELTDSDSLCWNRFGFQTEQVYVDTETGVEILGKSPQSHEMMVFHPRCDPKHFEQAMNSITQHLLQKLDATISTSWK